MPYNYSQSFLAANQRIARDLIALAERRRYQVLRMEDASEAMRTRFKVNNVLASLVLHHPDLAWVRKTVRTWLRYNDGYWELHIGVPPADVTVMGAPPKLGFVTMEVPSDSRLPPVLLIEEITRENSAEIFLQLADAKQNPKVKEIRINTPPVQAGIEYLIEKLAPEFRTNAPGAKPLVFERVENAATQT